MEKLSESVFVGICHIVGTSQQIAIRRASCDISEMVLRRVRAYDEYITMMSGSYREGFRMAGSDVDFMRWPNDHRVIMEIPQSEYYNTINTTLILSDSSESPPGFTLLQLLTSRTNTDVLSALVRMNDKFYISSSIHRQVTCSKPIPNSTIHGPCCSGVIDGTEYDGANCFKCDVWPTCALSWKNRCHSWPGPDVVDDIVRSGYHFVAIGHPLGLHENEEWRISFSQAEHKCVYAMNYCQFLIYGLLKLFLKEVLNKQSEETSKLLCSYHIKTVVFWAIQQNTLPQLCPQNLLVGFWVCFKLLLKWVHEGICPNFFIPENNLFLAKVYGSIQIILFLQLHELYKKGLACLLQSSSIRSHIIDVMHNPRLSICSVENSMLCEVKNDVELVNGSSHNVFHTNIFGYIKAIKTIENLVDSYLTHYEVVNLQNLTVFTLQCTAFLLHKMSANIGINKQLYIFDKISCQMLKLAVRFGCISDLLYIAMYYYKTHRYTEAASVIEMTKIKLAKPYLLYMRVDIKRYTEAMCGQSWSWSTKRRQAVANDILFSNKIIYISELIPEQQSALQYVNKEMFYIPVFVFLHFLQFLCCRNIDLIFSQAALDELLVLVHHDQGLYVSDKNKYISWVILGICQQITGNLHAALYSYQQSLTRYPGNSIQTATQMRIRELLETIPQQ